MKKDIKNFDKLDDLYNTIRRLRAPDGCEWDNKQTSESLIPYLLEEVYEVIEAIENKDFDLLKEELGDLLLHIVFQADLAKDKNKFSIEDSIDFVNKKLISRHPHIFDLVRGCLFALLFPGGLCPPDSPNQSASGLP